MFFFRIGFCLNTFGELQLTVNSQTAGSLLTDLPTDVPLWVIIDVYGSTQSVQFVQVQGTINILNFFFFPKLIYHLCMT